MSIIGHLICLALATPTMTDELIMKDLETVQAGIVRIIGASGNTTNAYMKDGKATLRQLNNALSEYHEVGTPSIVCLTGMDEARNEIPFTVILKDVVMIMLFPPPSNLALARPGISNSNEKIRRPT